VFRLVYNGGDPLLLPLDLSVVIGRSDQCDLQLHDPSASRTHCRVIATDGRVTVTDQGSRWGTFVNGQQVTTCDLRPGDRLTVGETIFTLRADDDAQRTTLARGSELIRPEGVDQQDSLFLPVTADSIDKIDGEAASQKSTRDRDPQPESRQFRPEELLERDFFRYSVRKIISVTSSGVVYEARDKRFQRPLALKVFHPAYFEDDVAEQRFQRATRIMFEQRHPHIVQLYNAGKQEGLNFTASQFVDGESAVDMIARIGIAGMLDPTVTVQLAVELTEALAFAEQLGIVHRNIKPSNILVRAADRTALLNDLILAKSQAPSEDNRLTQAGEVLGDVHYLSPEQLGSGHAVDCRSDIYQLGATLYALLTGRPPHDGGSIAKTITEVLTSQPQPIREVHLATPPELESVVMKMLSKNPANRYATANALSIALKEVCAKIGHHIVSREIDPKATGWRGAIDGML